MTHNFVRVTLYCCNLVTYLLFLKSEPLKANCVGLVYFLFSVETKFHIYIFVETYFSLVMLYFTVYLFKACYFYVTFWQ